MAREAGACEQCGGPLPDPGPTRDGRKTRARFCSGRCRQRTYRRRRADVREDLPPVWKWGLVYPEER